MARPAPIMILCSAGLILLILVTARLAPGGLALSLTLVQEGRPILILPMDENERFTLHYYHSVEIAPIWETHSLDTNGDIFIEEERYEKFGAGMGKMPGVGRMIRQGRYEVIKDMHMPVGDFVLRVGSPGVDHTLIWRGRRFNLSERFFHKAVIFSGQPVSLLHKWWYTLSGTRQMDNQNLKKETHG